MSPSVLRGQILLALASCASLFSCREAPPVVAPTKTVEETPSTSRTEPSEPTTPVVCGVDERLGVLSRRSAKDVRRRAIAEVVLPCARTMLSVRRDQCPSFVGA